MDAMDRVCMYLLLLCGLSVIFCTFAGGEEHVENRSKRLIDLFLGKLPNGLASLCTNYIAQNIIGNLKSESPDHPKCNDCIGNIDAEEFCYDCRLQLCISCTRNHLKSTRTSQHRLTALSIVPDEKLQKIHGYCKSHNELLKYFCKDCQVVVCHDCLISNAHSNHQRGLVSEVSLEYREEILTLLRKGKEVKEILQSFCNEANTNLYLALETQQKSEKVIEDAYNEVVSVLDNRKQQLLSELHKRTQESIQSVASVQRKVKVFEENLSYSESVDKEVKGNDIEESVKIKKQLESIFAIIGVTEVLHAHNRKPNVIKQEKHNDNQYKYPSQTQCNSYARNRQENVNSRNQPYGRRVCSANGIFTKTETSTSFTEGKLSANIYKCDVAVSVKELEGLKQMILSSLNRANYR